MDSTYEEIIVERYARNLTIKKNWMTFQLYPDYRCLFGYLDIFLAHAMQRVSNIVGLTAIRLAFFMGCE